MAETIHRHVSPPYRVNCWMGSLLLRHSWQYHAGQRIAVADPGQQGHIHNREGQTVVIPPGFRDELQPDHIIEAEAQKPTMDSGQAGRALLDPATPLQRPDDFNRTSDATAGVWRRGKVFSGKIKF